MEHLSLNTFYIAAVLTVALPSLLLSLILWRKIERLEADRRTLLSLVDDYQTLKKQQERLRVLVAQSLTARAKAAIKRSQDVVSRLEDVAC